MRRKLQITFPWRRRKENQLYPAPKIYFCTGSQVWRGESKHSDEGAAEAKGGRVGRLWGRRDQEGPRGRTQLHALSSLPSVTAT